MKMHPNEFIRRRPAQSAARSGGEAVKKAFMEWLGELLSPWFTTREDYSQVHSLLWRSRETERRAVAESREVLDRIYVNRYQPFEECIDAKVDFEKSFNDIHFQGCVLRWQVRLADRWFICTFDPKKEINRIQEHVIDELANAFKAHVSKQLFGLNHESK